MIGFLRFIGVVNAAIWLGGSVFLTFFAGPAFFSPEMATVLGLNDAAFRNSAGRIAQVILGRYYYFHLICAIIAWLQLLAEWLYFGRPSRKLSFGLLIGLMTLTLVGGNILQPRLRELHKAHYSAPSVPERDAAAQSFRVWHGVSQVLNLIMIVGLTTYIWSVTRPTGTSRYISSVKFRG